MQPGWETVCRLLQKLKIELPYDPSVPLMGVYPKTTETLFQRDTHPYVCCSIIYNSQEWIGEMMWKYMCVCIYIYIK